MLNIGILGGSFNPIHLGHLILAENILNNLNIDEIWFMINPNNPLKSKNTLIDLNKRIKMLKLSIKDNTKFKFCDIELNIEPPNTTIKTIYKINEIYKNRNDIKFHYIFGDDILGHITTWEGYDNIVKENLIICYRDGLNKDLLEDFLLKDNITYFKPDVKLDISSTIIREKIKKNECINHLVKKNILKYLVK